MSLLKTALDSSIYLKATIGCLNDLEVCICIIYVCLYLYIYMYIYIYIYRERERERERERYIPIKKEDWRKIATKDGNQYITVRLLVHAQHQKGIPSNYSKRSYRWSWDKYT